MVASRNPHPEVDWSFLETFVDAALAVARNARECEPGSARRAKRIRDAAKALHEITHMRDEIELNALENEEFEQKVGELRKLLENLGDWF
jgi:hypothetical protein